MERLLQVNLIDNDTMPNIIIVVTIKIIGNDLFS